MAAQPYGFLDRNRSERDAIRKAEDLRAEVADPITLRRSDLELLGDRYWPQRHHTLFEPHDPGPEVAFLTVANDRFCRGLEGLLLSLRAVYPQLASRVVVAHDGSIGPFLQRRLCQIHATTEFVVPEAPWADQLPRDSANRERIGLLGYLNGHALALRGHRRVLALDADLLVTGALDPLWARGDAFRAVPDCGDRPWAAVSAATGRPVLNSGVISIPGSALTTVLEERFTSLTHDSARPVCPLLDRFADQKVWNLLLADQPLELLPLNFNCNVKFLLRYLEGCHEGLSIVHFAGPKPWLTWPWVPPQAQDQRPLAVADHLLWNRHYRRLLMTWRLRLHREAISAAPPLPTDAAQLVRAPEALQAVPAGVSRHLLLADPAPFEGDWPDAPAWPVGWFDWLRAAAPVQIWAPFEWEPAVRDLPLPSGVIWRWVLIEAPFSPALGQGEDLIADTGAWAGGFEPWSDPAWIGVARAAQRQLEAAGAGAVESPHR